MDQSKYVFSTKETRHYRFPTHINDLVLDRSEAEHSEAYIVIVEPGKAPPLHSHSDLEQILYVVQGDGTLQIGRDDPRHFKIRVGDLVRIPPSVEHLAHCDSREDLVYLSIDCFVNGVPPAEPTWDSHVRNICKNNGWDFDQVTGSGGKV